MTAVLDHVKIEQADCFRVTKRGLLRWRFLAGQAGIDAWCRLHNLDPMRTMPDLYIHDGLITGDVMVVIGGRITGAHMPFSRTLIAPPPPCALEVV